jgi:outer membrane protein OmpA-like peptidoglycan-associated protein
MKRLLLLLCILLASQVTRSQTPTYVPAGDRNYWGLELGVQYNWLAGADNFAIRYVYPYNSLFSNARVTTPLAFDNPGDGIGFSFGGTFDINLAQNWNLMAKVHYSIHNVTNKEQFSDSCTGGTGIPGVAEFENTIEQHFGYFGGDILIRYQFNPESWYGFAGLGFMAQTSNSIFLAQAILSSDNGCEYIEYDGDTDPSNDVLSGNTSIAIPEQEANQLYRSLYLGPKLGVGTFIPIGDNGWMLTPELMVSIPLSDLYNDSYTPPYDHGDIYAGQGQSSFSDDGVTTPKLWYAQLSIGLKFPWGGNAHPNEGKPVDNTLHKTDEINFEGTVKDRKTNEPVDDVEITVIDLATNEVVKTETTGSKGNYDVLLETPGRYSITAEKDGYLFSTAYIELDEYGRLVKGIRDIYLDKSQNKVRLLVFFETDKAELSKSSLPELQRVAKFLKANANYQVEIAGHTDNTADDKYNMDLSTRRANSVVDYLVRNGVDRSRLTAKGYGETMPVSTNDTEDGRSENRRVEFIITNK